MHQSLGILDCDCNSRSSRTGSFDRMKVASEDSPQKVCFNFGGVASLFPFLPATNALDDPKRTSSSSRNGFTSSCSVDEDAPCCTSPPRKLEQQHSSNTTSTTASSSCDDSLMEPLVTDIQELLVLYDDHDACDPPRRRLKSSSKKKRHHHHTNKNSNKRSATTNLQVVSSKLSRHCIDDFPIIEWSDDEINDDNDRQPSVFKSSKSMIAIDGCLFSSSCPTDFLAPALTPDDRKTTMLRSMSFGSHLGSLHILQGPIGRTTGFD